MTSQGVQAKILLMGPTGCGKSQFANCASGSSDLPVGRGLASCTTTVALSKPFFLNGQIVTMIDTPGFDDTNRSDADVLSSIAAYLAKSYEDGLKLAGIIFRIFRELCGDNSFKNALIVTNMWETTKDDIAQAREEELATSPQFFKSVLDKGAEILRHDGTRDSALAILRHLVQNGTAALAIQQEIVDEGKALADTAAGVELSRAMTEQAKRHDKELKTLRTQINQEVERMRQDFKLRAKT